MRESMRWRRRSTPRKDLMAAAILSLPAPSASAILIASSAFETLCLPGSGIVAATAFTHSSPAAFALPPQAVSLPSTIGPFKSLVNASKTSSISSFE